MVDEASSLIVNDKALIVVGRLITSQLLGFVKFLSLAALIKLIFVNNFPHEVLVDTVTESIKAIIAKFLLFGHKCFDIAEAVEFAVHLTLYVGEDVEHHGDHNVEEDPLDENVEHHEVDTRPDHARCIDHGVSDSRPVVNDHEGVKSHDTASKIVEVNQIVEIIWNAVLTVEFGLHDEATKSLHSNDGENVVDNVEAGQLVHEGHRHLHNHLHDDLKLAALLQESSDSQVTNQEGKRKERGSGSVVSISRLGEHSDVGKDGDDLADDLEKIKLLLSHDSLSSSSEDDIAALDEVDACEWQREHLPEAASDVLDLLELVIDDEEAGDRQVEDDEDYLHPTIKESFSLDGLHRPVGLILGDAGSISSQLGIKRVDSLQLGDLNKVRKGEELLESLQLVLAIVVHINDVEDLGCYFSMHFVVIVIFKDIREESLGLHTLEIAISIGVVLVVNDFNVMKALLPALLSAIFQALLVLVEDVGSEEVGEEVEADEHEKHEEEGVEVVHSHSRQENVREVGSREKDGDLAVGILDRGEAKYTFEAWSVEVEYDEHKEEDVCENGDKNSHGVSKIAK